MASTEAHEIQTHFDAAWNEAQADVHACRDCGEPFGYPLCDSCFEARWTTTNDAPITALQGR